MVLVDRDVYVKHMENILKDNTKFEKVDINTRTLNFQVNHEKHNEILKGLKSSGISPLTFKKVKLSAESSICDHLLFCNHDPSFDDFTILVQGTNKFLLEIKESLLIQY